MNKSGRKDDSTLLTMARVSLKSNFSIDAILSKTVNRRPTEQYPEPITTCDADDSSDADADINVDMDYESEIDGESH